MHAIIVLSRRQGNGQDVHGLVGEANSCEPWSGSASVAWWGLWGLEMSNGPDKGSGPLARSCGQRDVGLFGVAVQASEEFGPVNDLDRTDTALAGQRVGTRRGLGLVVGP
jgi:hypothetical protein